MHFIQCILFSDNIFKICVFPLIVMLLNFSFSSLLNKQEGEYNAQGIKIFGKYMLKFMFPKNTPLL